MGHFLITIGWLLLGLAGLALFTYVHPRFWAKRDANDFNKNPALDTFHDKFHRQRLVWRLCLTMAAALLAALPWGLFLNWKSYPLAVIAYFISSGGYFSATFNHLLSKVRGLAYVTENYVSPDPDAANPDAWIWAKVTGLLGSAGNVLLNPIDPTSATVAQTVAGLLLELLGTVTLIFSQTVAFFILLMALSVGLR